MPMKLPRDRKNLVRVGGSGCCHHHEVMTGEGLIGNIFKGLLSAGRKLFSNLKVQELARATGTSLLKAGREFAKKELAPAVKKSAVKFASAAAEEGVNRIVSQIEGSQRQQKDLGKLAQDISSEEMLKLKERVRSIAMEEGRKAKSMAIANLNNLGIVEKEYEKIADAEMYGQGLVRLGAKPPRRKRGRPRKRT